MKRFLILFVIATLIGFGAYAEIGDYWAVDNVAGTNIWAIDSNGDLIPGTDSSQDVGASGTEVDNLYVDSLWLGNIEKTSWGSIVSPMTDYTGYVAPTDSSSKLKLHDDGDLTLGGAVATDVAIIFDSDSNDYYVAVNDSENELQLGYGSAVGTTEQISIQSSGVIMIGEDADVDSGFVFQAGAQDFYMGIDYTGGGEEDLFCMGLGSTIGTTPELAIGKASGDVYVNSLRSIGSADLDIGTASGTDVTVVTDGGTIILDGTITLTDGEVISNGTDDTIRVASNDLDTVFEIYTAYDTTGDATLKLSADVGDAAKEQWTITSTGDGNDLVVANDSSSSGTPVTKFTLDEAGIVTSVNYVNNVITDTNTASVVDVAYLTHDGGTAATGVGTGLRFQIDDGGGIEEQVSLDAVLSTVTDGSEDADFKINQNVNGTMVERVMFDADGANLILKGATPYMTIGDAGSEDTKIVFDGVTVDYHMGLDDTDDTFNIGFEQALGTTAAITIATPATVTMNYDTLVVGTTPTLTIGDAGTEDNALLFDSVGGDYYMATDLIGGTSVGELAIGLGTAVGTTPVIQIATTGTVLTNYDVTMAGTTPLLTIGDAGDEDTGIVIDTNDDYYIAVDDTGGSTEGELVFGRGSAIGTTPFLQVSSAGTVTLTSTGGITATNIADVTREIAFTPADFTVGTITSAPLTAASVPGIESQNNSTAIVWADNEVTAATVTFRVPDDYTSGGTFYAFCDSDTTTTATQVDFNVFVNSTATAWDASASDQTPVALAVVAGTPETVTLTVATDFTSLVAGNYVTTNIWRDNTAVGTDNLELYNLTWAYESVQ